MEETRKKMNPLRIFCKNCGAPAGFDIIRQTYSCPNCGQVSGIQEVERKMSQWRSYLRGPGDLQSRGGFRYL